tara:strand:+ start:2047 stop:2274 length:228 start_codon:yes stop_codon:yes gene_type:complete
MTSNEQVDVNVLVGIYNQKIAQLTNQNILLEAKLESLTKDFETERENLLMQLMDKKGPPTVVGKSKSDFKESEVD